MPRRQYAIRGSGAKFPWFFLGTEKYSGPGNFRGLISRRPGYLNDSDCMSDSSKTNEFLRLLMANQKRIYAFILAMVPNHQDADDLFQETVLLMWSKFDSFTQGTSFVAWGCTIARYQILSVRKRHSVRSIRFSEAAMELLYRESDPFLEQMDSRTQALRTCIGKLAPGRSRADLPALSGRGEHQEHCRADGTIRPKHLQENYPHPRRAASLRSQDHQPRGVRMSQEGKIPSEFAEWIIRSLDGSISDEQFAQLDHEIAVNDDARVYYLEFITTYVGLVDVVGALPTAETLMAADSVSGVEKPGTQRRTAPGIVECPAPKAPGNEHTGALRIEPGAPEEDRIREIERYARQQLAAFLDREHADRVRAGPPGRRVGLPGRHRRVGPGRTAARGHGRQAAEDGDRLPDRAGRPCDRRPLHLCPSNARRARRFGQCQVGRAGRTDRRAAGRPHDAGRGICPNQAQEGRRGHSAGAEHVRSADHQPNVPGERLDHRPGAPCRRRALPSGRRPPA